MTVQNVLCPILELKENMRKTTNSVLEINQLLKEVRPLAEETTTSLPLGVLGVDSSQDIVDEDVFHDAVATTEIEMEASEIPIQVSCVELRQSVADFLEICLQELHDLT